MKFFDPFFYVCMYVCRCISDTARNRDASPRDQKYTLPPTLALDSPPEITPFPPVGLDVLAFAKEAPEVLAVTYSRQEL